MIFNQSEKVRKITKAEEFTVEEGLRVGEFAKKLFPDGLDIPIEDYDENIILTIDHLNKNYPLFEAGFEFDNSFSRVDILVPFGEAWDLIEVKSSTRVKDKHLHDVSFQKYVCEGNGLKIRHCFLLYLNSNYFKSGPLDFNNLFLKEDITVKVNDLMDGITNRIQNLLDIVSSSEPPRAGILSEDLSIKSGHDCFLENCLELPENNVFNLYSGKQLACTLYEHGIECIRDIPKDFPLTEKQKIQWACEMDGKIHLDKEEINKFLEQLHYPLYFLDFETFSTAIPLFDGLKPYSHVPFQFSVHVLRERNTEPEHFEFLYNGNSDPRNDFLIELMKVLGTNGSIVVYNKQFERHRLLELAQYFPNQKPLIDRIIGRLVDLLTPFRNFSYYHPKQQGSASLKVIYHVLTGESYQDLVIRDGRSAPIEFLKIMYDECDEIERELVRNNLLKYCQLDTLAQVKIVNILSTL